MKNLLYIIFALGTIGGHSQTLYVPSGTSGIGSSINGNVGVGTSNPLSRLHLYSPSASTYLNIEKPSAATEAGILFSKAGNALFYLWNDDGSDALKIEATGLAGETDATPRMEFPLTTKNIHMALSGGNVGIGITNPSYRLDVNGSGRFNTYLDVGGQRNINSAMTGLNVYDPDGGTYTNIQFAQRGWGGSHAILFNAFKNNTMVNGDLTALGNTKYANNVGSFSSGAAMIHFGGNSGYMDFYISPNSTGQNTDINWQVPVLALRRGGNVGIGTTNPDAKLAVKGTVHANEVKVDLNVPGPDYVFANNYQLPTLNELKTYIDQNKHLPEVPSAKQMEAYGINLGEMNMLLLKKVEELTLYLIEKDRELQALKSDIEKLKNQNYEK